VYNFELTHFVDIQNYSLSQQIKPKVILFVYFYKNIYFYTRSDEYINIFNLICTFWKTKIFIKLKYFEKITEEINQ